MTELVRGLVDIQEEVHAEMLERVQHQRARGRTPGAPTRLPVFTVGGYVLVARIRKLGSAPKLVITWTGPWRVVSGGSSHMYVVEDIVTAETKRVHVVRMRPYADASLALGPQIMDVFAAIMHQGEFIFADIVNIGEDPADKGESRCWCRGWALMSRRRHGSLCLGSVMCLGSMRMFRSFSFRSLRKCG